jgi:rubrerythrin
MNIFDCAIKKEEEAVEFYQKLAVAAGQELKLLFTMLALDKKVHINALLQMKESIDLQMSEFEALREAARMFRPLLAKRDLMTELNEDTDVLQLVVEQQERGGGFYEELAEQANNDGSKKIWNKYLSSADSIGFWNTYRKAVQCRQAHEGGTLARTATVSKVPSWKSIPEIRLPAVPYGRTGVRGKTPLAAGSE